MNAKLLHIYGPLFVNSYGVALAIGLLLLVWRAQKDPILKKILTSDQLYTILMLGIFSGVIGGRLLYLATNWQDLTYWHEALAVWQGGLSITGAIISILVSEYIYVRALDLSFFTIADRFALYAPLAQAFGRIGCFLAGCCHGTISSLPWAVMYTDKDSFAPLYVSLHPAQLYSAGVLLCVFLFLHWYSKRRTLKTGQLTLLYLTLVGTERFIIDFWRGDRSFTANNIYALSVHQLLSGGIVIIACTTLVMLHFNTHYRKKSALRNH